MIQLSWQTSPFLSILVFFFEKRYTLAKFASLVVIAFSGGITFCATFSFVVLLLFQSNGWSILLVINFSSWRNNFLIWFIAFFLSFSNNTSILLVIVSLPLFFQNWSYVDLFYSLPACIVPFFLIFFFLQNNWIHALFHFILAWWVDWYFLK